MTSANPNRGLRETMSPAARGVRSVRALARLYERNHTMRRMFGIALAALLAGCATPADRAAQMEREVDEMIVVYGPACERLGFTRDSDAWRDCILRLSAKEAYERYQRAPGAATCFGHRGFYRCTTF